jgi:hypothetical protein
MIQQYILLIASLLSPLTHKLAVPSDPCVLTLYYMDVAFILCASSVDPKQSGCLYSLIRIYTVHFLVRNKLMVLVNSVNPDQTVQRYMGCKPYIWGEDSNVPKSDYL